MKAEKHITAIIAVLFIGFTTLNGQTTVKRENRGSKEHPTVKRPEARKTQPQARKATTRTQPQAKKATARTQPQARKATTRTQPNAKRQTVERQRTNQLAKRPKKSVEKSTTTRYGETVKRKSASRNRPVSISTPHNPRSDYRASDKRIHVKNNKYSEKRYYSGHHYHHVYPAKRVKTRYHRDTHIHNYNVLYYPSYHEVHWTYNMHRDYRRWYPNYNWSYNYGYRIHTLSVFDAKYNMGEVAMVYGRVYATWHNKETDDFLLFFGGDYPAQQFTVVLPGHIARRFSWRPERHFLGEHMTVTGLITTFDGIPEIIVKNRQQVGIY
ncbi:MAG: hypothetical protein GY790_15710 [Bacteroidetes bacterium]|nr:hypothetical protein [Bacteroidota bacterium]